MRSPLRAERERDSASRWKRLTGARVLAGHDDRPVVAPGAADLAEMAVGVGERTVGGGESVAL